MITIAAAANAIVLKLRGKNGQDALIIARIEGAFHRK
jgi:hypothetical protein